MKDWITSQQDWLTVERLPGHAHDLNPVPAATAFLSDST